MKKAAASISISKNVFNRSSSAAWRRLLWVVPALGLSLSGNVHGTNTPSTVTASTSTVDLSNPTSYSVAPTATTDVNFNGAYTGTPSADINGAALSYGTLNDNSTTTVLTITNANAADGSITLNTAADGVGGAATDLLYVKSGDTLNLQSGAGVLTLELAASGNIDSAGTLNLSGPITLDTGTTTTFTGNGKDTITGNIDGAGATNAIIVVNNGSGTVTLAGTNSYTGLTTLTAGNLVLSGDDTAATGGLTQTNGTLYLNSATALGTGAFTINGGTIRNSSGGAVMETNAASSIVLGNSFSLGNAADTGGNGNINFGTGPVFIGGSRTITLNGTGATFTFGGAESSTAGGSNTLTVNGAGNNLVFTGNYFLGGASGNYGSIFNGTGNVSLLGAASSFSGGQFLTYSGTGVLTLGGTVTTSGLTTVSQGTLSLDFSQDTLTSSNILRTSATAFNNNVVLSGPSTLAVVGATGATNSQALGNVSLVGANTSSITLTQNGATSLSLSLGAVHRSLQSTVDFTPPTTGAITVSSGVSQGVIASAVADGGATWATYDIPTSSIGALSTYSSSYTAGSNVDVMNGDAVSNVTVNTLRFNSAGETLTLGGTDTITDGVLVTPTATGTTTITGGTIETNNAANELVFQNYGGTLDLTGTTIADNGNPTSVTIGGTGTTYLNEYNTYTGVTTLTGGTLSLNGSDLYLSALAGGVSSTLALGINTLYIDNGANNAVFSGAITGDSTFSAIVKTGSGAELLNNPLGLAETYGGIIDAADGWLQLNGSIGSTAVPTKGGATIILGGGYGGLTSASATPTTLYLVGSNNNNLNIYGGGAGALTVAYSGNTFVTGPTAISLVNDPTVTFTNFGYDYLGRSIVNGQTSVKEGVAGAGNLLLNSAATTANTQFYGLPINNSGWVNDISLGVGGGFNIGSSASTGTGLGADVTALIVAADGGGTVDYEPSNDSGFAGSLYINSGMLVDDTTNNAALTGPPALAGGAGVFNSAVSLTMGGGTFQLKGNATNFKVQDQVLNGLTLSAGASTIDADNVSGATSTTIDFGPTAIIRNVGGTVNFTSSVGTFGTTSVIKTGSANDAGGILGGYATVNGTSWATVSSGVLQSLATGSYGTLATSTSTTNVDVAAGAQAADNLAANTLRFNSGTSTLTLADTNVLTDGGILDTTAGGTDIITGGTLEGAAGADLVVIQNNTAAGMTIASTIADNTSATALTKSGAGLLTLTGANTYTGNTYVNAGTLNVASLAGVGTASSIGTQANGGLVLNGGTLQYTGSAGTTLSTDYTLTTAGGTFDASGTGALTISGAMTVTGTSQLIGGVSTDVGGAQNLNLTGGTGGVGVYNGVITNGSVADDYTAVNKTGAGTWTLSNANTYTGFTTISAGTLIAGNVSALGNLSGVNVVNPALVVLSGGNLDLATDTSIDAYNLEMTANSTLTVDRATSGAGITQNLGTLSLAGGLLTVNAGGNISSGTPLVTFNGVNLSNGSTAITSNTANVSILGNVTGTATTGGNQTLTLGNNTTGVSTISGTINDGPGGGYVNVTRNTGKGVWVLSGANTYSGATSIVSGALNIQNNSALGTGLGTSTSSVSIGNGGALQLQGGITTTTAVALNLNGSGLTGDSTGAGGIENVSGNNNYTGLITLTGSGDYIGSDNGTLTLSNQNAILASNGNNDNLYFVGAGNIVLDSAIDTGNGTVNKINGTGTAYFYGASAYAGTTTISAGTLAVENTSGSGTGTGAVNVNSGGTLGGGNTAASGGMLYSPDTNGAALQVYQPNVVGIVSGQVTVASGGNLAPGNSVGTLTLAKLTLSNGAFADYEFNATSNDFTLVTTAGGLSLGTATFNLYQEGSTNPFAAAGIYDLIGYTGTFSASIAGLTVGDQVLGYNYGFSNDTADGIIQLDITATPEPSTWALMAGGLGLLFVVIRRRQRANLV